MRSQACSGIAGELPAPVKRYLQELEVEAKQCVGVVPEAILEDARGLLIPAWESWRSMEAEVDDATIYARLLDEFGIPAEIALAYEQEAHPARRLPGIAPGWRICCTRCGRSAPAAKVGITRVVAKSWHKYVLGWCHDCRSLRMMRLQQDLDDCNLTMQLGLYGEASDLRKRTHKPWLVFALTIASVISLVSISAGILAFLTLI